MGGLSAGAWQRAGAGRNPPAAVALPALLARTYLEDGMLKKELKGYKEYCKKVKYRLVPGLW